MNFDIPPTCDLPSDDGHLCYCACNRNDALPRPCGETVWRRGAKECDWCRYVKSSGGALDPNAALAELLKLARTVIKDMGGSAEAARLAELVLELDEHLAAMRPLPDRWDR